MVRACVLSWASPSSREQRKCLSGVALLGTVGASSQWLQGPWLKAGITVDSVKLNQLKQKMGWGSPGRPMAPSPSLGRPLGPWKAASMCQKQLALHETMSPLLTGRALINICKRNEVENSTCVGGGRAWDMSTTPMALFSQDGSAKV